MENRNTEQLTKAKSPTELLPLTQLSRTALSATADMYEAIIDDYERVGWERIQEIDRANQQASHFLDLLQTIAKLLPSGRVGEIAAEMTSYIGELNARIQSEAGHFLGLLAASKEAFRQLCERHNIVKPCDHFISTVLPLGSGWPPLANCDTCGHPSIVHDHSTPVPATAEAAS